MLNTAKRFETPIHNERTSNYAKVTVVTYRSFLDGGFNTYYRVEDGRDEPREYHLDECELDLVKADKLHDEHCRDIHSALDRVNLDKVEELWDLIQELRRALYEIRRERGKV